MNNTIKFLLTAGLTISLLTGCTATNALYEGSLEASATQAEIAASTDQASEDNLTAEETELEGSSESSENPIPAEYTLSDLNSLENTDIFVKSAIEHIFNGTINKKGQATGYHYDGIIDSDGKIVDGTKSAPDSEGIYKAQVEVKGIPKSGNKGYSSFYPDDMSPQDVINSINEAYNDREHYTGNIYAGESNNGMLIEMYLTDDDKIISAFPIYEGDDVK